MKIHAIGFDFLLPYCVEGADFVVDPTEADFVLTMNNAGTEGQHVVERGRSLATRHNIPFCWWTIEDPNAFGAFGPQAQMADYVFTSDRDCIPVYHALVGHDRVYWLPLAASEAFHKPLPLAEDATDFVLSANWYHNEARDWGVQMVILPLAEAGYSMTIYSLEPPPYDILKPFWIGPSDPRSPGYFSAVAQQYQHGKVVLGLNNQRSGMDGRQHTVMTSMRTFEALACGKPFLAAHSDAYEALGFVNDQDFLWADYPPAVPLIANRLLDRETGAVTYTADGMAERGRAFVLAHHTYGHRMRRIERAIGGTAEPGGYV